MKHSSTRNVIRQQSLKAYHPTTQPPSPLLGGYIRVRLAGRVVGYEILSEAKDDNWDRSGWQVGVLGMVGILFVMALGYRGGDL